MQLMRRALLDCAGSQVSFEFLERTCWWREVSLPSFVPPCGFYIFLKGFFNAFELTLARGVEGLVNLV